MIRTITICAALAAATGAAWAHHGWGSYTESKPVTVAGAIMTMKFDNPHANVLDQAFLNAQITHDAAYGANLEMQFVRRDTGLGEQGKIVAVEGGREMVCGISDLFHRITAEIGLWRESV